MKNRQENRREYIRVKSAIHFCINVIESIDEETGKYLFSKCFSASTIDISLGGMCISHCGDINVGFGLEISTPEKMTKQSCMTCENAYLHKNPLALTPIFGTVVWMTSDRCGIKFNKLSIRKENILSKYIWEAHLNGVRNSKQHISKRKF